MIVVIDGPAGSGKSSSARAVAERAGFHYLDSGAFYRAVTYAFLEFDGEKQAFFDSLYDLKLSFEYSAGQFRISFNGTDISDAIRRQEVSAGVSEIARHARAREYVNRHLREFVKKGHFIADGRDLGTVVFPDADLKFYLVADLGERARRRHRELSEYGQEAALKEVEENLNQRDHIDSSRAIAPLRKAEDAIEIDTSRLGFEEQVGQIIRLIENCRKEKITTSNT